MSRTIAALSLLCLAGCMDSLEKQVQKSPDSIIGKKTKDIGEFDPKAGKKVSDSKVEITDPITGPLQAYGPALEKISKSYIEHALNLFHASEDRYPKSHEEFMTRIIKENNIELPVLPGNKRYEYDVANHKLVVVDDAAAAKPEGEPAAPEQPKEAAKE